MLLHVLEDGMLLFVVIYSYSTGSCTKLSFFALNFDLFFFWHTRRYLNKDSNKQISRFNVLLFFMQY